MNIQTFAFMPGSLLFCQNPISVSNRLGDPTSDLWVQTVWPAASSLEFCTALVHTKYSAGKFKAATVLIGLSNHAIVYFRLKFSGTDWERLIPAVADTLVKRQATSRSEAALIVEIEDLHGCHLEFLGEAPENPDGWCLNDWRQRRLAEVAQSERGLPLTTLRSLVDREAECVSKQLSEPIAEFRQKSSLVPLEIELKLPRLSWVAIHNYLNSSNPLIARNRLQAILLFPTLTSIAIGGHESTSSFAMALKETIDAGRPLIDFVMHRWEVKGVAVKALHDLGFDHIGEDWITNLRPLLHILSGIAPEKYPKSIDQWRIFSDHARSISTLTKMHLGSKSVRVLMASASKRCWRTAVQTPVEPLEQVRVLERFSTDLQKSLKCWAVVENHLAGRIHSDPHLHQVIDKTLLAFGLDKIVRVAIAWMTTSSATENIAGPAGGVFPTLLVTPFLHGDLEIIQLKSMGELQDESESMKHCVDSYASSCKSGQSVIFSIRTTEGSRQSTFELAIRSKGLGSFDVKLVQHKGFRNVAPSLKAKDALTSFLTTLRSTNGTESLQNFTREKLLFNLDPNLARDHRKATLMRKFITQQTGGRIDFDRLVAECSGQKFIQCD